MTKKSGSSSWLTAVKRAFRSPTKDNIGKNRDENHHQHEQDDHEDQKKREKRRWLFRKPTVYAQQISNDQQKFTSKVNNIVIDDRIEVKDIIRSPGLVALPQQSHANAVAVTTQTAAEIFRPTKGPKSDLVTEHYYYAAIVIQAAFRGYLARRALRAMKGVVKLQALVRGQNVRKQAKLTLKCMEALVRVQEHVSHQRARLSLESRRKSMLGEISTLLDYSTPLHDIRDRLSISREMSSGGVSDWDDCPQASEDIEAKLLIKKEAALKRGKALAYASFSNQIRSRPRRNEDTEDKTKWLDRWMAKKQWESDYNDNSPSAERRDQNIITVQIDTSRSNKPYQGSKAHQTMGPHSGSNITSSPSPSKPRQVKVRSASPQCQSAAHIPSLAHCGPTTVPNYMAATESTRARARPNSTPRQKPSTPERDQLGRGGGGGSVKKRLSYNSILEPASHLKSPCYKSLQNGYLYVVESLSSCYDESVFGRDVSPCSTTDLRWLK